MSVDIPWPGPAPRQGRWEAVAFGGWFMCAAVGLVWLLVPTAAPWADTYLLGWGGAFFNMAVIGTAKEVLIRRDLAARRARIDAAQAVLRGQD